MSEYWSDRWNKARRNMPRVSPSRMGSPTVLRTLLGYKVDKSKNGVPAGVGQHCRTAEDRGDKPRNLQRRRTLELLAGPYGTTFVKIIAIQRGLDLSRYKYWPDGKGGFTNGTTSSEID